MSSSATVVRDKHQVTLPAEIVKAAKLRVNDQVEWRYEEGEIRGRKLVAQEPEEKFPPGSLLKFFTPERAKKERAIASGCLQQQPVYEATGANAGGPRQLPYRSQCTARLAQFCRWPA